MNDGIKYDVIDPADGEAVKKLHYQAIALLNLVSDLESVPALVGLFDEVKARVEGPLLDLGILLWQYPTREEDALWAELLAGLRAKIAGDEDPIDEPGDYGEVGW